MEVPNKTPEIAAWKQVLIFLLVYTGVFTLLGWFIFPLLPNDYPSVLFYSIGITSFISIALVWLFARWFLSYPVNEFGLPFQGQLRRMAAGICLATALIGFGSVLLAAMGWVQWTGGDEPVQQVLLTATLLFLSAFSEELVFRGLILSRLMRSFQPLWALSITSILFCLFHITNPGLTAIALLNLLAGGFIMGITFAYTRNIWFGVFLHWTWNLLQGPVLGFPVSGIRLPSLLYAEISGPAPYTGGDFGLEGSLLQFMLLLAGILGLYLINIRQKGR